MEQRITIGRDRQSNIIIDESNTQVSGKHCDIVFQNNQYVLYEHSSNGTYVNGQKYHNTHLTVSPQDDILLAGTYRLDWNLVHQRLNIGSSAPRRPQSRPTTLHNNEPYSREPEVYRGRQEYQPDYPAREQQNYESREQQPYYQQPQSVVNVNVQPQQNNQPYQPAPQQNNTDVERRLARWNWGAFYFGWLWGVFHKCYWPLTFLGINILAICLAFTVILLPLSYILLFFNGIASLVASIMLGIKGRRIAWDNGCFDSIETLERTQHYWAVAALICFLIPLVIGAIILSVTGSMFAGLFSQM